MNQLKYNSEEIGYLQLIIGPMYSGKTTAIMEIKKQYDLCDISSCVVNYAEDTRYSNTMLCTHDKKEIQCKNVLSLRFLLDRHILDTFNVFFINEGQFFPDLYEVVKLLVEEYNKVVYVCGLDGDFKRNGFEQMMKLIPFADDIVKKYSLCVDCKNGTKALFSFRKTQETEVKVIGSDNYIPLCRKCYLSHTKKQ
jgi:thymidine kinase